MKVFRRLFGVVGLVVMGCGGAMAYAGDAEAQKVEKSAVQSQEVRRGGGGWWTLVEGSIHIPGGAPRDPREGDSATAPEYHR